MRGEKALHITSITLAVVFIVEGIWAYNHTHALLAAFPIVMGVYLIGNSLRYARRWKRQRERHEREWQELRARTRGNLREMYELDWRDR
jgi:uncharacterized membrane protein